MAEYKKSEFVGGKWAKGSDIKSGTKCKIVSETAPQASQFKDDKGNVKTQDVAKVQFKGNAEALNVSLNRATINGLVDAYGEDSKNWQGHLLTAEVEKVRVAGKSVHALYLIPDGYSKVDDEQGFAKIVKNGVEQPSAPDEVPVVSLDEEDEDDFEKS